MAMSTTFLLAIILLVNFVLIQGDSPSFSSIENTLCNLCKKKECSKIQGDSPSFSSIEDTLCNLCKKKECSKLEGMSELQAKLYKHNKDIQDLQHKHSTVAFFAYLGANLPLNSVSKGKTIIYDQVNLNLGNGYDKTTGLFTAPSEGTYVFHVSTGAIDRSHVSVELVQNGNVKDIGWADSMNHDDRTFVTNATPLYLKKGDVVNARIGQYFGGNMLESNVYPL